MITDQYVIYIPDCEIASGREGILDNQQVMQYKQTATRDASQSIKALFYKTVSPLHEHRIRQVSEDLAYRQVCSKFICVHTDPQVVTYCSVGNILSRTIVIEPRMLLDVIPRQYAHRETSVEFMLSNGYSLNFDFYDMYTSGKKFVR